MTRQCPDRDRVAVLAHVAEIGDPADVDERPRPRDTELHRGDQRVPAGEELRVLPRAEQLDRFLQRTRELVLELGRNHDFAS